MSDAAWHPDPLGRFELRWWDGEQWTEHVATDGHQGVDPEPIVVGGAQEDAGEDAAEQVGTVGSTAAGAAATVDVAEFDPPRVEDAISLDEAAGGSWPSSEQSGTVEEAAATPGEEAAEDGDGPPTADDGSAAAEVDEQPAADPVPAGDADTGVTAAVDGDEVAPGTEAAAEAPGDTTTPTEEALPGAAVLAVAPASAPPARAGGALGPDGIGGGLLDDATYAEREGERVVLQNRRLLKVSLGRDVMIKRGSMVAYQGQMTFEAESEGGGFGSLVRRAASTDNSKMARASGTGDLFLADAASEVHLLELDGGGLVVNGPNLLAFEDGMTFRTRSLGNAGIVAGGVFVTDVSGTGWVAVTANGTPVRLTTDAPTYVDAGAAVAWSSSLQVDLNVQKLGFKSVRSGEIAQLVFRGEGFVLVQASEGGAVPPHTH